MPNREWDPPAAIDLVSPLGTLNLNVPDANGHIYIVRPASEEWVDTRATVDDAPEQDSQLLHRFYFGGDRIKLAVAFGQVIGGETGPACGSDLRAMVDALMLHLRAIIRDDGRLIWTPTYSGSEVSYGRRMLDLARYLERVAWSVENGYEVATFTLASPLPYAIDLTQTVLHAGVITNNGNCPFYPVIKAYGAFSTFAIVNTTTGKRIDYNSAQPGAVSVGGGNFAEIDCVKNSIYLNGSGADLLPAIILATSDFFTIDPGANTITSTVTIDVLFNNSWA